MSALPDRSTVTSLTLYQPRDRVAQGRRRARRHGQGSDRTGPRRRTSRSRRPWAAACRPPSPPSARPGAEGEVTRIADARPARGTGARRRRPWAGGQARCALPRRDRAPGSRRRHPIPCRYGKGRHHARASAGGLRAAAEGALLGAYAFDRYRFASRDAHKSPVAAVTLVVDDTGAAAKAVLQAAPRPWWPGSTPRRDLVNASPSDLYPASFAALRGRHGAAPASTVTVLDEKALRKGGYGGITGVGQGSSPPAAAGAGRRTPIPRPPVPSPSSARASPSTRAASRSSRPPRWSG